MTTQEKKTQDTTFDFSSCKAIMEKMMGENGIGCDCAEMMSRVTNQGGIPEEWLKMMSQMMDMHCRPWADEEKPIEEV